MYSFGGYITRRHRSDKFVFKIFELFIGEYAVGTQLGELG
jgi:hypothetical protein